jgi:hypothetical protein
MPIADRDITKGRRKFTFVDDHLLVMGLDEFGFKDLNFIQQKWLPEKKIKEVRHRYKNLTCGKAKPNPLKSWKQITSQPFSKEEIQKLFKGVEWFSTSKWEQISKYFLPDRPTRFLEK